MPDIQEVARGLRNGFPPFGHAKRPDPVEIDTACGDRARCRYASVGKEVDHQQRENQERQHPYKTRRVGKIYLPVVQSAMEHEHSHDPGREHQRMRRREHVEERPHWVVAKQESAPDIQERQQRQRETAHESCQQGPISRLASS